MDNLKNIKAVIFDFDGTLADTGPDIVSASNALRESYGLVPLPYKEVFTYIGNGSESLMKRLIEGCEIDHVEARQKLREFYAGFLSDQIVLYPGILKLLNLLQNRQIKMSVLSSKSEDFLLRAAKYLSIDNYFDSFYGQKGDRPMKPDAGPTLEIINGWGFDKDELILIGDSDVDVATAHNVGIKSVFFTGGIGRLDGLKPTIVIDNFSELFTLFK